MRGWLQDYARFQAFQATRAEMLAGAPSRSTELHAMHYCNTPTRTTRNLTVIDKFVSLMRLYTKTGGITGVNKLIPHALDAFTADLLIQDLAMARPFAEHCINLCYPDSPVIKHLYKYHLFVNNTKAFVATDLMDVMEEITLPIMNWSIGINAWRHIHVNFSRKHCTRTQEILDECEEDTPLVAQYGHSRSIHEHIYGRSYDALVGLTEDAIPLFLEASTYWQVLVKMVPGMCLISFI
jgi:hypothetical protein